MLRFRVVILVVIFSLGIARADGPGGGWRPQNQISQAIDRTLSELANVVVREKIVRYSQAGSRVRKLDAFDAAVEVLNGAEQYSEVRRKNELFTSAYQIGGLWSFGEMATLLRITGDALRDGAGAAAGDCRVDALACSAAFRYPDGSRRWFVTLDSRVYWLGFKGEICISRQTGELTRISWVSDPLPRESGVDRVHWSVGFHEREVAGRRLTLPEIGIYRVTHATSENRTEWNLTTFSDYARYGSEVSFRAEQ